MKVQISNITVPFDCPDIDGAIDTALKKQGIKGPFSIYRKSLDARKAPRINFVYSVLAECDSIPRGASVFEEESGLEALPVPDAPHLRPVVVGFGPAGMFSALILAEKGLCPIVLEQGDDIDIRTKKVERYFAGEALDPRSNVQFGEGGAGSFSDGKLMTRIKDRRSTYVMKRFAECGADEEIMYLAHPHIGTDRLKTVVKNIREKIISLGGEVRFSSKVTDIKKSGDRFEIEINDRDRISSGAVFLAIGHSARDSYMMLMKRGLKLTAKDFSVGLRIEHKRAAVERSLYGSALDSEYADRLPSAEYQVSVRRGNIGVYSFCMCPGGFVIASESEENTIVTNGMSCQARDGENSNSAIAFSVTGKLHGNDPLKCIDFQRELERRAFDLGGKTGRAPYQTVEDFVEGRVTGRLGDITPTYPRGVEYADLGLLFDRDSASLMRDAFGTFERRYSFFSEKKALLTGVESRTSSPVRIGRDADTLEADGCPGIYPIGEGAGYAGGITSAAVDGLRAAEKYILKLASYKANKSL